MDLERIDLGERADDAPLLLGQAVFLSLVAEPLRDRFARGEQQHRQCLAKGWAAVRAGAVQSARSKPRWHAGFRWRSVRLDANSISNSRVQHGNFGGHTASANVNRCLST